MVHKSNKNNRFPQNNPNRIYKGTDWLWLLRLVTEILGLILIGMLVQISIFWFFYTSGAVWDSVGLGFILFISLMAFAIPYYIIWQKFIIKPQSDYNSRNVFIIRFLIGMFILATTYEFNNIADDCFRTNLTIPHITPSTNLDNVGRIHVKQFRVDTLRGIGITFDTHTVKRDVVFSCHAVIPIQGRDYDYFGIAIQEQRGGSLLREKQIELWYNTFVERTLKFIKHSRPNSQEHLKRVPNNASFDAYRDAVRNGFGSVADYPFTIWEADVEPAPTTSERLLFLAALLGGTLFITALIIFLTAARPEYFTLPLPFIEQLKRILNKWPFSILKSNKG